jgi:hypothetical protein
MSAFFILFVTGTDKSTVLLESTVRRTATRLVTGDGQKKRFDLHRRKSRFRIWPSANGTKPRRHLPSALGSFEDTYTYQEPAVIIVIPICI